MEHDVKVWPEFFRALERGHKTFEVRKDDRGYAVGDTLLLREWNPTGEVYTGNTLKRVVTYKMPLKIIGEHGVEWPSGTGQGYCVLGIKEPHNEPGVVPGRHVDADIARTGDGRALYLVQGWGVFATLQGVGVNFDEPLAVFLRLNEAERYRDSIHDNAGPVQHEVRPVRVSRLSWGVT